MARIVLDTNVLVSAFISDGKPRMLLRKGIKKEILIATSKEILEELVDVLRRPKFSLSEDEIHRAVFAIIQISEVVKIGSDFKTIEEDPDDDVILNTAYDGKVDYVVSGDTHLLKLGEFKGIRIISVDEMLGVLK